MSKPAVKATERCQAERMHKLGHRRKLTVTTSTSSEGGSAELRQSESLRGLGKDFSGTVILSAIF
jgi:hypothetical protein